MEEILARLGFLLPRLSVRLVYSFEPSKTPRTSELEKQ